jgi:hypothetical protein
MLFWRTDVGNRSMRAVRSGDWKLVVEGNHLFVFNLREDIGERRDLTSRRTDIANRLRPLLAQWEQQVNAEARVHYPDAAATGQGAGRGARGTAPGGGGTQRGQTNP